MALLAGRREARMRHGRRRVVVIRLVAGDARCHRDVVVVVDMATRARRGQVRPRQREARCCVIERRVGPQHCVMALFAGGWEAIVVHRRLCVVVIRLVAGDAGRRRNVVVIVDMAA